MKYISYLIIVILFLGCSQKEQHIYIEEVPIKNSSTQNKKPTLKPYKVLGKWYYPRYVNIGETFRGVSSWYGADFHGKLTANGEIYNMYDYTAANKIMPMNTIIRVRNLNNNKSVVVRVNDRGPFMKGRILDLSYIAGKKIGLDKTGTAPVEITVLKTPNNFTKKTKLSQKNGKIKIQIGAFKNLSGANIFKREYSIYSKNTFIRRIDNKYKVYIGYFNSYNEAKKFKIKYNIKGFIVK